jgi:O-antigen biosynthesis alpha-1,2-mannosyltransferase
MMHKPLAIVTDKTNGSFTVVEHLYALAFQKLGQAVKTIPQPNGAYESERLSTKLKDHLVFHNTIGPNFSPIQGCINVALPVHEWSRYPKEWAKNLSLFDQIWVTTEYVETLLKEAGTTAPILRLPPPLDLENIPQKQSWDSSNPFRFYFCGESHFRKGLHLLIPAFMEAFPEPGRATLTIKTNESCNWDSPREDIILIKENWTREQCLNAYQNYDCYVSASLGEGFGLPVAEAILAGLPIATNYWGGHKSLLKPGSFFEIPHIETIQPYASRPEFYVTGQRCCFSDVSFISETLSEIAKSNASQRQSTAEGVREHLLNAYSSSKCLSLLKDTLESLFA